MSEFVADFDEFPADAMWLPLDDETPRAYAAFCAYRDAGPLRSLRQACRDHYRLTELPEARRENVQSKVRVIQRWSSKYDWVVRARAYSTHLDRLARVAHAEEYKAMKKRHAEVAALGVEKAAEKLGSVAATELTAREALSLLDVGVRVEREAREALTDIVETEGPSAAADRQMREIILADPRLALAARDLALALHAPPQGHRSAGDYLKPWQPADQLSHED